MMNPLSPKVSCKVYEQHPTQLFPSMDAKEPFGTSDQQGDRQGGTG